MRRRRAQSVLMGALLFVPHAGRVSRTPPLQPAAPNVHVTTVVSERNLVPEITITTTFSLPAEVALAALIQEASAHHGVDPLLIREVVRRESAFNPLAVSTAGAQGLMQLMPALSQELGVLDPFDARENVFAGVRYLRYLLDVNDGDETLALASYNAGPGAVATHAGVPPFPETQEYVRAITERLARQRSAAAPSTDDR